MSAPKPIQVAAAVVGNALEWYDFIIFGFLTIVIARLFFPADSQYASLLLTTATFGVGFFMRPVGGILLGLYADYKGRKSALLLIIVLMTVAIAMIGFAPTYAAVGIAAPLIVVLARLLQGLATGGEFASATSFLIETAPGNRAAFTARGRWSARVSPCLSAHFWARSSHGAYRRKHSTVGVGGFHFCLGLL
jgi:MFS transporter, MHS family, proline/betaine transporter